MAERPSKKAPAKLLAGGNPQIAKGEGDAKVQEYLAALPGWKRDQGVALDTLISKTVPKVRKAVKWNSPFYGLEGKGWMVSFHAMTKYLKVAFFDGASLDPEPPVGSTSDSVRYLHVTEGEAIDERQFVGWLRQAAKLPGWGSV